MAPHALIMGAHGFIGRGLAKVLLKNGYTVTGICRSRFDKLEELKETSEGRFETFYRGELSITIERATEILNLTNPNVVVWSGAPEVVSFQALSWSSCGHAANRTQGRIVDAFHACNFAHAAAQKSSVSRYLHLSFIGGRAAKPAWWSDDEWAMCERMNAKDKNNSRYSSTHRIADEQVYLAAKKRGGDYAGVALRTPIKINFSGPLTIALGKTASFRGPPAEEAVVNTAAALLEVKNLKTGWLDLTAGQDDIVDAVMNAVSEQADSAEDEPFYSNLQDRLAEISGPNVDSSIWRKSLDQL